VHGLGAAELHGRIGEHPPTVRGNLDGPPFLIAEVKIELALVFRDTSPEAVSWAIEDCFALQQRRYIR